MNFMIRDFSSGEKPDGFRCMGECALGLSVRAREAFPKGAITPKCGFCRKTEFYEGVFEPDVCSVDMSVSYQAQMVRSRKNTRQAY